MEWEDASCLEERMLDVGITNIKIAVTSTGADDRLILTLTLILIAGLVVNLYWVICNVLSILLTTEMHHPFNLSLAARGRS